MTDNASAFALGEPCAQNNAGELLWDFETIAKAVSDAIFAEREACAKTADQQVGRWGDCSAQHAASECANAIRARGQQ